MRFFTVHTAFGLPGSSETAISDTSRPWRKTRTDERGPRPHIKYNCGVSSLARSATWQPIKSIHIYINLVNVPKFIIFLFQAKKNIFFFNLETVHLPITGAYECSSSTITRFFNGRGAKKNVSPSSSGIAELNSGSSSSSPRWAIWYR